MTTTVDSLVGGTVVQTRDQPKARAGFDEMRRQELIASSMEIELIRVLGIKETIRSVNWPEAKHCVMSLHLLDVPPPGVERLRRMIPGTPQGRSLIDWADAPGASKHAAAVVTDMRDGTATLVATVRGTMTGKGQPSILAEHSDARIRLCRHHGRMYISRASTDPLYRATGMATLVTLLLLYYASGEGCADAYCAIWNQNIASQRLVTSLGFLPSPEPVRYFEEEEHVKESALDMVVWSFPIVSISSRIVQEFGNMLISLIQQGMDLRLIFGLPNPIGPDWFL